MFVKDPVKSLNHFRSSYCAGRPRQRLHSYKAAGLNIHNAKHLAAQFGRRVQCLVGLSNNQPQSKPLPVTMAVKNLLIGELHRSQNRHCQEL